MRLIRLLTVPAAAGLLVLAGMSSASAGEITGNGKPTPPGTFGHAASICSFSGLDDGSEGGVGGPGSAPQNWGQIPQGGPGRCSPPRASTPVTPATGTPASWRRRRARLTTDHQARGEQLLAARCCPVG